MKRLLIGLVTLIVLILGAEGVYWWYLNQKPKSSPAPVEEKREEKYQEEITTNPEGESLGKILGKVKGIEGNFFTLEVKGGTKEFTLTEETTFFTTFEKASEESEVVKGGKGAIQPGKEVYVVYHLPQPGEIPKVLSVLVIY